MALCVGLVLSGCTVTDVFNSGGDDASEPAATATPTVAPTATPEPVARERPDLRHRFIISPPTTAYDPDVITATLEEQYITSAIERWSRTSSVHFKLNVDGATFLDVNETIELKSVEGDLKRPNRAQAEADIQIGFANFDVGLVVIGDDVYTTNFLTGDWESGPADFDFNPALIFDDERGVGAVLEQLEDVEAGAESTIGGTKTIELTGTIGRAEIDQLVAGSLEGDVIHVSLWMEVNSGALLQITLAEPAGVDGEPTAWVIAFSAHNEQVTINAPEL
jgi:hypothetical protein